MINSNMINSNPNRITSTLYKYLGMAPAYWGYLKAGNLAIFKPENTDFSAVNNTEYFRV